MIKANELRIGNWVAIPESGIQANVKTIDQKRFSIHFGDIDLSPGENVFEYSSAEGIPLTPEILDRFGFIKIKLGDTPCYGMTYKRRDSPDNPHQYQIILIDFGEVDGKEKGRYAFAIRELDRDIQFSITVVDYLHQLQNGVYFLTGEELTYNQSQK